MGKMIQPEDMVSLDSSALCRTEEVAELVYVICFLFGLFGRKRRISFSYVVIYILYFYLYIGVYTDMSVLFVYPLFLNQWDPQNFVLQKLQIVSCVQCNPGQYQFSQDTDLQGMCEKCVLRQQERKETIQEIIDTEMNYGRDLRILKEVRTLVALRHVCGMECYGNRRVLLDL